MFNPLDPLGSIASALKDAYELLIQVFERSLIHPLSVDGSVFSVFLYGNAAGVYQYLAELVVVVAVVSAIFSTKGRVKLAEALLVFILVGILGPLWFTGADKIVEFGDQLTAAAVSIGNGPHAGGNVQWLPSMGFSQVIIAIIAYLCTLVLGGELYGTFVTFSFLTVMVKFFGLIALSLLALGDRTRKIFSFLVAIGLVVMIIGRPVATLIVASGQGLLNTLPKSTDTMWITAIVTCFTLWLALIMQPILMYFAYKGVAPIVGKVAAKVKGDVRSLTEIRQPIKTRSLNDAYAASLQSRARAIPLPPRPGYISRVGVEAHNAAVAKTAAILAAKAAVSSTGIGKVALVTASIGVRAMRRRPQ